MTSSSKPTDIIASFRLFASAQVDFIVQTLSTSYSLNDLRYQLFLLAKNLDNSFDLDQKRYFYEQACKAFEFFSNQHTCHEVADSELDGLDFSNWNTQMTDVQILLLLDALEKTCPIPGERPDTQMAALGRFRTISDETLEKFLMYIVSHAHGGIITAGSLLVDLYHELQTHNIDTTSLLSASRNIKNTLDSEVCALVSNFLHMHDMKTNKH